MKKINIVQGLNLTDLILQYMNLNIGSMIKCITNKIKKNITQVKIRIDIVNIDKIINNNLNKYRDRDRDKDKDRDRDKDKDRDRDKDKDKNKD